MAEIKDYELTELQAKYSSKHVHIFEIPHHDFINHTKQPIELGVNWSAMGTCDSAETEAFIKDLQKALEFVKEFNKKKLFIKRTD